MAEMADSFVKISVIAIITYLVFGTNMFGLNMLSTTNQTQANPTIIPTTKTPISTDTADIQQPSHSTGYIAIILIISFLVYVYLVYGYMRRKQQKKSIEPTNLIYRLWRWWYKKFER